MIRKSDKKLKDRTKEDKIAKNEGFDEFFNQVLKNMPARSAKIIKSSFVNPFSVLHTFPNNGPYHKNPTTTVVNAATKIAKKLISILICFID